ncbi:hypothetical protein RB200_30235 [Streptomyces sp. PmtG]
MTDRTERDEILDFPGADELIAAGAVAPPSAAALAATRERWARQAEREREPQAERAEPLVVIGSPEPPCAAPRRSRRARRGVLAAAVAAVAVAITVAAAVTRPAPDEDGAPAAAMSTTAFLTKMAAVASNQPALKPGRYWMVRAETAGAGVRTWHSDLLGNRWETGPHGTVRGKGENTGAWLVGSRWLPGTQLNKLSTDPDRLIDDFPKAPAPRFDQVTELLEESPASPWLRFALLKVLARTPGVELGGPVKDSRGRSGMAITFTDPAATPTTARGKARAPSPERPSAHFVIDPKTARVLETQTPPGGGPATRKTFLKTGWTNRVG